VRTGVRQDFSGGIERLGTGALRRQGRGQELKAAAADAPCDSRRFAECRGRTSTYLEKTSRENSSRPKEIWLFPEALAHGSMGSHTGGDGGNGGVDRGRSHAMRISKSRRDLAT